MVIGLMGVGKSTLGRLLADALSFDYVDSDDDINRLFGTSGGVLAERLDVPALHRIESGVLLGALAREEPAVISAAASVVEDLAVREAVANRADVVWLHAELDEVLHRQGQGDHRRPMARDELAALAERRLPLFESMANVKVIADGDPSWLVELVLTNLPTVQPPKEE